MNESRRVLKRIFIAVIYLAVFAGLGTGAYFLFRSAPKPSVPSTPVASPIEIIWSDAFVSGPNLYSAAAQIKNPNTNFGANFLRHSFYFYDENETLLDSATGDSFIWPGESKYIVLGGINLAKAPAKTILKIENPAWQEIENFKGINLTVGNVSFKKEAGGSDKFFSVNFTASNDTLFDLSRVYITAIVLDGDKMPIAAASTLLENLKSKENRPFLIPWFSAFPGMPAGVILNISANLRETPALIGQ